MGRYRYSRKTESDGLKKLSTSFLKKHKYFEDSSCKGGVINWTQNDWAQSKSSVGVQVSTIENFLRIYYAQTNNETQEKKDFDYKIPLTTTPCFYGGKRYWFVCPWYKKNQYCGRRVAVLYKDGDCFACRHCYNLTYSSRNLSGYSKLFGTVCLLDVEKARMRTKRLTYKGKYTKSYSRYLKLSRKLDDFFIGMESFILNRRVNKAL